MHDGLLHQQKELFDWELQPPKSNLLRWAGSKASYASRIGNLIDFERPYFEPFCGSAAIFFRYAPNTSYLNDNNTKLISFYRQLAEKPEEVSKWYIAQPVEETRYYEVRSEYNAGVEPTIEAAMFLYLNHFGFNGVYRTNQSGKLNTPYGARVKPKRQLTLGELLWFSKRLQRRGLTSLDFEEAMEFHNPVGACIFLDPPYYTTEARVFNEYGKKGFQLDDLYRLRSLGDRLSKNNKVVISYRDCGEFRNLFSEFVVHEDQVARRVSGATSARKKDTELIAVMGK